MERTEGRTEGEGIPEEGIPEEDIRAEDTLVVDIQVVGKSLSGILLVDNLGVVGHRRGDCFDCSNSWWFKVDDEMN